MHYRLFQQTLHKDENPVIVNAYKKRIPEVVDHLIHNSINYRVKKEETTVSFTYMGDHSLTKLVITESELPKMISFFYSKSSSELIKVDLKKEVVPDLVYLL